MSANAKSLERIFALLYTVSHVNIDIEKFGFHCICDRRVENFNASLEYFIANYKAYSALNCSVLRIPKERNAQHPKKYLSTRYSIDFVEASDV